MNVMWNEIETQGANHLSQIYVHRRGRRMGQEFVRGIPELVPCRHDRFVSDVTDLT